MLYFCGYSMAKAYQNTNIQTNVKIAEPILIVKNNPVIEVNGKNEKEYYNFTVKNCKENGDISQIELEYYVEIIKNTEEAISFKLYKNNEEIPMENNRTSNILLKRGEIQEDNYKLEITYDKNKNHSIEDIIQDVQIKVHSEQIKL